MAMNGGKRVVLSTILGIVLAAAMIISLSTFTTVEQTPPTVQANMGPRSNDQSSMKGLAENKPVEQAPPQEWALAAHGKTSVTPDPTTVGAPFALALLAGVGVFLVVRSRVK